MPTPLEWLATAPWPSVPELAGFMYVDRTTISRQMPDWRKYSLVGLRNVGFLVRPRDRLLIATAGLDRLYPDHHTHPGPEGFHDHDPLHPEWEDHGHPGYFNSEEGALSLYQKLPLAEVWYPLAPAGFAGRGSRLDTRWSPSEDSFLEVAEEYESSCGPWRPTRTITSSSSCR